MPMNDSRDMFVYSVLSDLLLVLLSDLHLYSFHSAEFAPVVAPNQPWLHLKGDRLCDSCKSVLKVA